LLLRINRRIFNRARVNKVWFSIFENGRKIILPFSFLDRFMKNILLVIFDLDGTLLDAYQAIYRSVNFTLGILGYPAQKEQIIRRAVGWGDRNLLMAFIKEKDIDRALAVYRRHHAKSLLSGTRLFPGVRGLLSALRKKGCMLAVASNRPTRFSLILLRHCGLRKFFDMVLCGDKVKRGKPDPEILRSIMKKLDISSGRTIYVGDMVIDIQAARRAGCSSVAVVTGSSTRAELAKEKPEAILPQVRDLLKLLPRGGASAYEKTEKNRKTGRKSAEG
jgi:2-phosphoglycolate phosphatase